MTVFIKVYKKYTAEPYSFLANDTTEQNEQNDKYESLFQLKKYYLLIKTIDRKS